MDFLKKAHSEFGVRNIEMEVNMMAAMCTRMEVKCKFHIKILFYFMKIEYSFTDFDKGLLEIISLRIIIKKCFILGSVKRKG